MVALGFSWLLAGLSASNVSGLYIVGVLLNGLPFAILTYLLFAFPSGRPEHRSDRISWGSGTWSRRSCRPLLSRRSRGWPTTARIVLQAAVDLGPTRTCSDDLVRPSRAPSPRSCSVRPSGIWSSGGTSPTTRTSESATNGRSVGGRAAAAGRDRAPGDERGPGGRQPRRLPLRHGAGGAGDGGWLLFCLGALRSRLWQAGVVADGTCAWTPSCRRAWTSCATLARAHRRGRRCGALSGRARPPRRRSAAAGGAGVELQLVLGEAGQSSAVACSSSRSFAATARMRYGELRAARRAVSDLAVLTDRRRASRSTWRWPSARPCRSKVEARADPASAPTRSRRPRTSSCPRRSPTSPGTPTPRRRSCASARRHGLLWVEVGYHGVLGALMWAPGRVCVGLADRVGALSGALELPSAAGRGDDAPGRSCPYASSGRPPPPARGAPQPRPMQSTFAVWHLLRELRAWRRPPPGSQVLEVVEGA